MAAIRSSVKLATIGVVGAGATFTGYQHYQNTTFLAAYAESLPSDSRAALKKMEWKGFTEMKLKSSEQVNHNVKKLTFSLPAEDNVTGISAITSLLTRHTPEGGFIPVFRPYTPVSDNDIPGEVSFMVKKYLNGKGSGKMHSMKPGDSLLFKTLKEFDYEPNQYSSMLFIAGGSGITPIFQLTRAILRNPKDTTKISLIYANNSEEDILLRKEFEDLEKEYPGRFQKLFTVSKKSNTEDGVEQGYVTKEMIGKLWPGKQAGQKVLVSGPPAMVDAIAGAKGGFGWTQGSIGGVLKDLGYLKDDVHKF